jgi:D-arginine dehydrogenase
MIDFLVIGGGIAGLSAGARLSELGTVTVLEGEDALGYHASGRSAALFETNYGSGPTVALSRASADYFGSANGGYLTPRGLMLIAGTNEKSGFESDAVELGMSAISVDAAIKHFPVLNPDVVTFAAYHENAQDIDTDRMMQDFAKVIRANGGQVLTKQQVTEIQHDKIWRVTAKDTFEARNLVNAAGAWADVIAIKARVAPIGLTPCRRSMVRIPAPGGLDVRTWPMLMGVGETWYAKPDAGSLLVSPADEDAVDPHDAYTDDMVLAEGLARYEHWVTEPVTRIESNWAGLRSFAPDRTLVLGPDPDTPSFIWCAAQGGYGFLTAPAASRLLADLVAGTQPQLETQAVAGLRPDRLR